MRKMIAYTLILAIIAVGAVILFSDDKGIHPYGENAVYLAGECFVLNEALSDEEAREALEALLKVRNEQYNTNKQGE